MIAFCGADKREACNSGSWGLKLRVWPRRVRDEYCGWHFGVGAVFIWQIDSGFQLTVMAREWRDAISEQSYQHTPCALLEWFYTCLQYADLQSALIPIE